MRCYNYQCNIKSATALVCPQCCTNSPNYDTLQQHQRQHVGSQYNDICFVIKSFYTSPKQFGTVKEMIQNGMNIVEESIDQYNKQQQSSYVKQQTNQPVIETKDNEDNDNMVESDNDDENLQTNLNDEFDKESDSPAKVKVATYIGHDVAEDKIKVVIDNVNRTDDLKYDNPLFIHLLNMCKDNI